MLNYSPSLGFDTVIKCTHAKGNNNKKNPKQNVRMLDFKFNIYYQYCLVHYQVLINLFGEPLNNMLEDSLLTFMLNFEFLPKS